MRHEIKTILIPAVCRVRGHLPVRTMRWPRTRRSVVECARCGATRQEADRA